ncbi:ABC transporter permease [Fodinicola feengrottensis]|uniref:ABC transporter permease n=1 Tax=Fodinicola feengrottensis TaxID=435914 RepID=A0ABP4TK06_9ACTN|nr:ABC transporter permease [Fodinicola feengrottensis]
MTDIQSGPRTEGRDLSATDPHLSSRVRSFLAHSRIAMIAIGLVLLIAYFAVTQPTFTTEANIKTLLTSVSILWMLSMGLTFVLILGGFDLSIGSMMALSGFILAWFYHDLGFPIFVACVATVVLAGALGALSNGFLIGRLRASFMVVTLGTLSLFRGLVNLVSGTETKAINSGFLDGMAFGSVVGIPIPVIMMAVVFFAAWWVLRFTHFGRDLYAVGGNFQAARLAGINTTRVTIWVYAICASAAALGAVLQCARVAAASPQVGDTIMFDAAAAVLLGGTALRGGSGGVVGTAIGVLFLGTLANGLAISGVPSYWQQILSGLIVAGAAVSEILQREGLWSINIRLFSRREPH